MFTGKPNRAQEKALGVLWVCGHMSHVVTLVMRKCMTLAGKWGGKAMLMCRNFMTCATSVP